MTTETLFSQIPLYFSGAITNRSQFRLIFTLEQQQYDTLNVSLGVTPTFCPLEFHC